jgi:superfamily II DNA helicase RecQ
MEMEKEGKHIWKHVESHTAVLLISPEMLATPGFQNLLQTKKFKSRVYALIVDEIHLLNSWGAGFRPLFQQIGFLRARFPSDTVLLGLTATLRKDKYKDSIFNFLKLQPSKVHFIRRSNARPEVALRIRTIRANTNTEHFPELDWVLRENGHTLVFCPSIRTGFRLAVYLWHLDPRRAVVDKTIRLFNSLNSTSYNSKTLQLLQENDPGKITIATDKLSVGVDIPNFETVDILDPLDLDDLWQKGGRVGRDRNQVKSPKVIVYIPTYKMAALEELVSDTPEGGNVGDNGRRKKSRGRQTKRSMQGDQDEGLARVVTAKCPVVALDEEYDNPTSDPPCSDNCTTCSQLKQTQSDRTPHGCQCSGCHPAAEGSSTGTYIQVKERKKALPLNIRLWIKAIHSTLLCS